MSKLLLVDGHNLLFRAYGVPFRFYSPKGTPLHVLTAFLSLLRRSVATADLAATDELAIVFDTPIPTNNRRLSAEYKANRVQDFSLLADSPIHHLPLVTKVVDGLGLATYTLEGTEADDVIATLTGQAVQQGKQVFIASSDTDFYQLLSGQVRVVKLLPKGLSQLVTQADVETRLGIPIARYVDYKALVGDPADNIKGVPGVGPVTARKLVLGSSTIASEFHDILAINRQLIRLDNAVAIAQISMTCKLDKLSLPNNQLFRLLKL